MLLRCLSFGVVCAIAQATGPPSRVVDGLVSTDLSSDAFCSFDPSNGLNESFAGAASPWTHLGPCKQFGEHELCVYSSTSFAGRHGVSIVTSPEKADVIAKRPGFVDQQATGPQDADSDPPYHTAEIYGKGIGLVAGRAIQMGDLVMSNTPAVLLDATAMDTPDVAKILLQQAIDRLPHSHRESYLNLSSNKPGSDHASRIQQILYTNSFDIDMEDKIEGSFYGTFTEISRFNHDCRPNCNYYFDPYTLTHNVYANRDIQPGEELTITYVDPTESRKQRMRALKATWGFQCSCKLCTRQGVLAAESDSRLRQIADLTERLSDEDDRFSASPYMAELLISLYKQERLWGHLYEAYYLAAIQWNGLGEAWKATEFARLGFEAGLISAGPRDPTVGSLKRLISNPVGHWSWSLKLKNRAVARGEQAPSAGVL